MKHTDFQSNIFNWLVNNYYTRVLNTSFYYLKNKSDAEDVTQEVFIKAFEIIDFSKTEMSKFPILFIMAKNMSLNRLKSKSWKEKTLPDGEILSTWSNPESNFIVAEEIEEITDKLYMLQDKDREILMLKHYQDCSYKEISEILNIPIGTVMSRLHSARQNLRENLKED